jgi:hypothetical protein
MRLSPVFVAMLLAGCDRDGSLTPPPVGSGPVAAASQSAAAPADTTFGVLVAGPYDTDAVVAAVNPDHRPRYTGPKGTLRGTIRVDGDPPPDTKLKFPPRCTGSEAAYGKLFRVGLDHALADVLVAVTKYGERGYVAPADEAVKVLLKDCVPSKLTYTVTFGQRIDVSNGDRDSSYLPYLDGAKSKNIMVSVPHALPIKLYPSGPSPAHYMLRDDVGSGLTANIFLLNYATHDVTGLDGRFEIKNIPVGKVRVDAMLPVIGKSDGKEIEIVEGDNTFDLTLHFDAAKDLPHRKTDADAGAPAASGAPSAAPPKKVP